jgi:hypothetical protein
MHAPALGRLTRLDPAWRRSPLWRDPMSPNVCVHALGNPLSWINPVGTTQMVAPSSEAKIDTLRFLGGFGDRRHDSPDQAHGLGDDRSLVSTTMDYGSVVLTIVGDEDPTSLVSLRCQDPLVSSSWWPVGR